MAKNRKRRKRRVPEILWRLFRHRARTLADTIVSLIPPLPHCGCNGRRCLGCIGGDADSYLLRPQDPCDYRKLLSECFVVVSYNAPPLSTIYLDRRWSQLQFAQQPNGGLMFYEFLYSFELPDTTEDEYIFAGPQSVILAKRMGLNHLKLYFRGKFMLPIVRKTIEMIMCEQPGSSNVLCVSITDIMQAYQFVFGLPVSNVQTSSVCDSKGFPLHQMELAYHLCQQYDGIHQVIFCNLQYGVLKGRRFISNMPICNNLSSIVELLTSSAWGLLLERVGDDIMVYLLKHTSIFLPLPHKMHCQVAGPPISDLCIGLSKHISDSKHQKPSLTDLGPQKKMERNDGAVNSTSEEQQLTSSFNRGGPVSFVSCVGCNGGNCLRKFSEPWGKKCVCTSSCEETMQTTSLGIANRKGAPLGECQQITSQISVQHRKRLRPSNYQQARKCSQLKFQGNDILGPYTTIPSKKKAYMEGFNKALVPT
ncbi:Telomerase reverse transcriptase [Vitis vinifera]|uniref:Telomerase reverse transcriptase n=1 Tax=Vitis vinifera TaxID=29760 RepID=A0A438J1W1_VITVI|nr:Telomerase reverse transcriptase [Vitis vinifera]